MSILGRLSLLIKFYVDFWLVFLARLISGDSTRRKKVEHRFLNSPISTANETLLSLEMFVNVGRRIIILAFWLAKIGIDRECVKTMGINLVKPIGLSSTFLFLLLGGTIILNTPSSSFAQMDLRLTTYKLRFFAAYTNATFNLYNLFCGESMFQPDKDDYIRVCNRLKFLSDRVTRLQVRLSALPAWPQVLQDDFTCAIDRSGDEVGKLLDRKWALLQKHGLASFY